MAENKNETKKKQLEENEIMRLSVKKVDSPEGDYAIRFESDGPREPMVRALIHGCEQLGLVCIPEALLGAIPAIAAICMLGSPSFGQDEEGGERRKKSEEESKE